MDHDEIQSWAEERGGQPAVIDHPGASADKPGIRIHFPGGPDELFSSNTRPASWGEFFQIFDEQELLLTYDEEAQGDDPTEWYHFEKRNPE
jgi:hypothetical protein